ncbi:C3a anaphylatoxin chemotactic receptor-like [Hemiscyllium ocellatum]|uniref:C3a anaphylatoxin chemotactic receptor-like n=1 Tax=Hemiscyllium ocellatum TaxID=170820 RepID=UPI00296665C8|nr:C3a anaphylatoxin chemotactic receptor-like [Hemiscyllium ocellatum]
MDVNGTLLGNWSLWDEDWGKEEEEDYRDHQEEALLNHTEPIRKSLTVVSMVAYAAIFALGVPGNIAVLWIVGFLMARRPVTVWFLNLAVADLLLCLTLPFLLTQLAVDYQWPFGPFLCKLLPWLTVLSMYASVFVLTGISVDRCLAALLPLWFRRQRSLGRARLSCASAWGLALLMSLPSLLYRRTVQFAAGFPVRCVADYGEELGPRQRAVSLTRFVFAFLLPLVVIAASNGLIAHSLWASRFSQPQSRRPCRLLLVVLLGFFLCWTPYHVVSVLLLSGDWRLQHWARTVDPATTSLAYLNSCLNPFLYAFAGRQGRGQLRRGLRGLLEGAFEEESSLDSTQPKPTLPTVNEKTKTSGL